jgi:hypothetical protein
MEKRLTMERLELYVRKGEMTFEVYQFLIPIVKLYDLTEKMLEFLKTKDDIQAKIIESLKNELTLHESYIKELKNLYENKTIQEMEQFKEMVKATPEQIKEFNEPELIKLEVGTYIYHPEHGVSKIHAAERTTVFVTVIRFWHTDFKFGKSPLGKYWFDQGLDFHKQLKLATPEQIKSFNTIWNEGIEEARKYKDGQPCLVSDCDGGWNRWELRYANGKGHFYSFGKRHSTDFINFSYHMPLNEQTIKNLPVNE